MGGDDSTSRRPPAGRSSDAFVIAGASQAEHWVSSYRDRIAYKNEVLLGSGRALKVMPAAGGRAMSADERLLRNQLLRYRARLEYWKNKVREPPAGGHR
ncbi:MAG: hypothetical protein E6J14_07975 [Chloroflexi bacterium]|nr:MAG: hypothetical protein E6J14_07975 [Chloroflexota bacterium]